MTLRFAPTLGVVAAALLGSIPFARAESSDTSEASSNEPAVADYERARALYRKASQAFEGGHYTTARELLLAAWALRQSYDVAASLGDTEVRLGLFADAAGHLSYSLRTFPPLENEQALATVHRQLDAARKVTAAFRVAVDQPGAEVRVDGRLVGTSPLADPIFVVPGKHTLEAKKGDLTGTQTLVGQAATEQPVTLQLAEPSQTSAPPVTGEDPGHRSVVPLIVGGAVVAVGVTAGIAFRLSASSSDDHANGIRTRLGSSGCVGAAANSADCVALRDDIDSSDRASALSTTGFVLAGVGLVAAPIWYFLSPRQNRENGLQISAFLTPSVGTVSASGRF